MKLAGYLLIALGFLGGALAAVWYPANEVPWIAYLPGFLAGAAGVTLVQVGTRRVLHEPGATTASMALLRETLTRVADNAVILEREAQTADVYELHRRIDGLFPEDLARFVEARETIARVHGLNAYAEVMNAFAAGERYLNRVWSASVDGYVDECRAYVVRARDQLVEARERLLALDGAARG